MSKVRIVLKEYDCNACANSKCNGDVIRGKKGSFKRKISCSGHVPLDSMRSTLLEKSSIHDGFATELNRILRPLRLVFQERKYYPFFRLLQD